jgi:hypothetical protein
MHPVNPLSGNLKPPDAPYFIILLCLTPDDGESDSMGKI